jgi:hypothetical protein
MDEMPALKPKEKRQPVYWEDRKVTHDGGARYANTGQPDGSSYGEYLLSIDARQ